MKQTVLAFIFIILMRAFPAESANIPQLPYANTGAVLHFVREHLPANPIIVEAGGFDGSDAVQMAQFWPHARIHTFEPVPELFRILRRRSGKYKNIYPYQIALSDSDGKAIFYLSVNDSDPDHVSASSSLLAPKEHLRGAPFVKFPYTIEVQTRSLDSWAKSKKINHVDFLWLDMQGYELHMIKASELAKNARAIWLEVEFIEAYAGQYLFKDIVSWMEANHFRLAATNFNLEKPDNWFADALFIKTE